MVQLPSLFFVHGTNAQSRLLFVAPIKVIFKTDCVSIFLPLFFFTHCMLHKEIKHKGLHKKTENLPSKLGKGKMQRTAEN